MIRLTDLPAPPPGRAGWPWTEGGKPLPKEMPGGTPWPRISIVTPSYNQGQFIEETIRSVLLQGYPELEYLVIDGGSTDDTVEVISKYQPWLSFWVSEKDRGQSHAINKGLAKASGGIVAYINSDDLYCPEALMKAAEMLNGTTAPFVYASCDVIDIGNRTTGRLAAKRFNLEVMTGRFEGIPQAAVFINTVYLRRAGLFDEDLHYVMDYDMWLRLGMCGAPKAADDTWAGMRTHAASKTTGADASATKRFRRERLIVKEKALRNSAMPAEIKGKKRAIIRRSARALLVESLRIGDIAEGAFFLKKWLTG